MESLPCSLYVLDPSSSTWVDSSNGSDFRQSVDIFTDSMSGDDRILAIVIQKDDADSILLPPDGNYKFREMARNVVAIVTQDAKISVKLTSADDYVKLMRGGNPSSLLKDPSTSGFEQAEQKLSTSGLDIPIQKKESERVVDVKKVSRLSPAQGTSAKRIEHRNYIGSNLSTQQEFRSDLDEKPTELKITASKSYQQSPASPEKPLPRLPPSTKPTQVDGQSRRRPQRYRPHVPVPVFNLFQGSNSTFLPHRPPPAVPEAARADLDSIGPPQFSGLPQQRHREEPVLGQARPVSYQPPITSNIRVKSQSRLRTDLRNYKSALQSFNSNLERKILKAQQFLANPSSVASLRQTLVELNDKYKKDMALYNHEQQSKRETFDRIQAKKARDEPRTDDENHWALQYQQYQTWRSQFEQLRKFADGVLVKNINHLSTSELEFLEGLKLYDYSKALRSQRDRSNSRLIEALLSGWTGFRDLDPVTSPPRPIVPMPELPSNDVDSEDEYTNPLASEIAGYQMELAKFENQIRMAQADVEDNDRTMASSLDVGEG